MCHLYFTDPVWYVAILAVRLVVYILEYALAKILDFSFPAEATGRLYNMKQLS